MAVERILIDAPRELDRVPGLRERLRRALENALRADHSVVDASAGGPATHLLQVVLGAPPAPHVDALGAPLEVRLRPLADGPIYEARAHADGGPDLVVATMAGFARAWEHIAQQRHLDVQPDRELLAALQGDDPALRDFAIGRAGRRRLTAAVAPLCALLSDEVDLDLALRVVGALVAIGSRRAVPPLIALSHQKPPSFVAQVAFAIGSLGGRHAAAYLVTLASGHPDEEVRRAAADALADMRRRRVPSR